MDQERTARLRDTADRVLELGDEVEAPGHASLDGSALDTARARLHVWIDSVIGVVNNPGLGRVTLIHENGRTSSIASPDLPFRLSDRE